MTDAGVTGVALGQGTPDGDRRDSAVRDPSRLFRPAVDARHRPATSRPSARIPPNTSRARSVRSNSVENCPRPLISNRVQSVTVKVAVAGME